jgi:hypothetical protein
LGCQAQQRRLSARAVSHDQIAARTQEGDHGGSGFNNNRRLSPHARAGTYKELGPVYLLRLDRERAATRLTQRLRDLGYEVELRKAAA